MTSRLGRVAVHDAGAGLFGGKDVATPLAETLQDLALPLLCGEAVATGEVAILHNPTFLKLAAALPVRIVARDLIVVAHETFLRPGGVEAFDVDHCLGLIRGASLTLRRRIAPVSPSNRAAVLAWQTSSREGGHWEVTQSDWFNICNAPMQPPTAAPRDRRGRLSRPGPEKFPGPSDLDFCFPATAEVNVILGGDLLVAESRRRRHWTVLPFRSISVEDFFGMIDFFVYFTAPSWRESFGRVIAEAIMAGKVVITDPATAAPFGAGVIAARPSEVDNVIAGLLADPASYARTVRRAQADLARYAPDRFATRFHEIVGFRTGVAA